MQKIYEKALKEGTMKVHRARIMLVGHFAAGKTSVLRSLLNEDFRDEHVTTDGVDTEETVNVFLSEVKEAPSASYTWEKVCSKATPCKCPAKTHTSPVSPVLKPLTGCQSGPGISSDSAHSQRYLHCSTLVLVLLLLHTPCIIMKEQ